MKQLPHKAWFRAQTFTADGPEAVVGVQMIASKMRPTSTTRGTHVAKQGSDADGVFFLQRGTVEARCSIHI